MLDTTPVKTTGFPDSIRRVIDEPAFVVDSLHANGCFRLNATRPEIPTYAGLVPGNLLRWTRGVGDSISFSLYGSPDAGHEVRAIGTVGGFYGVGQSWGAGAAAVDYPNDVIVGDYIGPPDTNRCREAGLVFLAWLRAAERKFR